MFLDEFATAPEAQNQGDSQDATENGQNQVQE